MMLWLTRCVIAGVVVLVLLNVKPAASSGQFSMSAGAPAFRQIRYGESSVLLVKHRHISLTKASHGAIVRLDATSFSFDPGSSRCNHKSITIPVENILELQILFEPFQGEYQSGLGRGYRFYNKGVWLPFPDASALNQVFGSYSFIGYGLYVKALRPGSTKDTIDFSFTDQDTNTDITPYHVSGKNYEFVKEIGLEFQRRMRQNVLVRQEAARREAERIEAERRALPADLKTTVQFDDSQSVMPTGRLEAGKKAELVVTVNNQGQGPAYDVALVVTADNSQITAPPPAQLGEIAPGQSRQVRVPLEAPLNIAGGELNVDVEAREKRGYNARKVRVIIPTIRLEKPVLSIENVLIDDGTLGLAKGNGDKIMDSGEAVELVVFVKNSGTGPAAAEVAFAGVAAGLEVLRPSVALGIIQPNQVAQGRLALALPRTYASKSVTLNLRVTDQRSESVASTSRQFVFEVNARAPELAINARVMARGAEAQSLTNDQTFDLEITVENTGKLDAEDVAVRVSASDIVVQLAQAQVGLLRAGEKGIPQRFTLALPRAFLKDKLGIRVELSQKDFPGRTFAYDLPVNPRQPQLSYRVNVAGRLGGADIEQNETAGLEVQVSNNGSLLASDVQVVIEVTQAGVEVQGEKLIHLGAIAPAGQSVARFRIRALRSVPPGALPVQLRILQSDFSPLTATIPLNVREEQRDVVKVDKPLAPVAAPTRHKPLIVLARPYDGDAMRGKQMELIGSVADQKGVSHVEVTVNGKPLPEAALRQGLKRRAVNSAQADDQADFSFLLALDFGVNKIRITAFNNENENDAREFVVTRLEDGATGPATPALLPLSDVDRYVLSAEAVPANSRRWAVIVGIEQYRKVAAVPFATRDAYAVREYAMKILGVPAQQVFLLTDDQATKAEMLLLFEERLQEKVQSGDTVFVYFAGHGIPEVKDGTPYLLPADGDPQSPRLTCYALEDFYAALSKLKAERTVIFLDACFSGLSARGTRQDMLLPGTRGVIRVKNPALRYPGIVSLAAAGKDEVSNAYKEAAHGLFTYFLLKGISEISKTGGKKLRLSELATYATEQVSQLSRRLFGENLRQTPEVAPDLSAASDMVLK